MSKLLPQEKLVHYGVSNLSQYELVQILISSGVKGRDYKRLARAVSRTIGKQTRQFDKDHQWEFGINEFLSIAGIGRVKACRLLAAIELGRRMFMEADGQLVINSPETVFNHCRFLLKKRQEYVVALYLNSRNELIFKKILFIGSVSNSLVRARDIIVYALLKNAVNIILVHNHPSGDPTPSGDDIKITQELTKTLKLLDIRLLDHVIVAAKGFTSLLEYNYS